MQLLKENFLPDQSILSSLSVCDFEALNLPRLKKIPRETTARSPKIRVFASTVIAGIVKKIALKIS